MYHTWSVSIHYPLHSGMYSLPVCIVGSVGWMCVCVCVCVSHTLLNVSYPKDPSTIEHQEAPGGEMYAMPQKTSKKGKKTKKDDELSEEEKAALYSVPDRKGQKAKSDGVSELHLTCLVLSSVCGNG